MKDPWTELGEKLAETFRVQEMPVGEFCEILAKAFPDAEIRELTSQEVDDFEREVSEAPIEPVVIKLKGDGNPHVYPLKDDNCCFVGQVMVDSNSSRHLI